MSAACACRSWRTLNDIFRFRELSCCEQPLNLTVLSPKTLNVVLTVGLRQHVCERYVLRAAGEGVVLLVAYIVDLCI